MKTLDTEGKRLKYIREKILGISQESFGTPIAKTASAIQKWEAGSNSIDPSIKLLLEHVYGINPEWLNTGLGEVIFAMQSLNGFHMPVYALSGKSYEDLFKKNNAVDNKIIMHADLVQDSANINLLVASKAAVGIEKDDLLVISSNWSKSKSPNHYIVEAKGVVEVRLLKFSSKDEIIEINNYKASEAKGFPFDTELVSLDKSQIKAKVIKIIVADQWQRSSTILI